MLRRTCTSQLTFVPLVRARCHDGCIYTAGWRHPDGLGFTAWLKARTDGGWPRPLAGYSLPGRGPGGVRRSPVESRAEHRAIALRPVTSSSCTFRFSPAGGLPLRTAGTLRRFYCDSFPPRSVTSPGDGGEIRPIFRRRAPANLPPYLGRMPPLTRWWRGGSTSDHKTCCPRATRGISNRHTGGRSERALPGPTAL